MVHRLIASSWERTRVLAPPSMLVRLGRRPYPVDGSITLQISCTELRWMTGFSPYQMLGLLQSAERSPLREAPVCANISGASRALWFVSAGHQRTTSALSSRH